VSHSPQPLEFFVDRSLGRHRVAEALRRAGWMLHTHHEIYGDRDEELPDVEWLEFCGREGFPVLTKDRRIRHRPAEIQAICRFGVRLFAVTGGSLTASDLAARFDRSRKRIEEACADAGAFVYSVQADRIVRIFP
jgi:PIN domain-containing protein